MALSHQELEPFRLALAQITGKARERPNPVDWAEQELKEKFYAKQREIAHSVHQNRRTAVPACFDSGKSFLAARIALWWISTHAPGDSLVVTTATTFHQVRAILWQELRNAHEDHNLIGKVNQTEWFIGNKLVGFGRRPRDWSPDAFTGHHRPYVLVIVDESSGVPKVIFEALEGLITNEESRILAIGNPYGADSHFAHICRLGSIWNVIQISAFDTPAFTKEEMPERAIKSLISETWLNELKEDIGDGYESHPLWQTKVKGEFLDENDDQIISLAWVRNAIDHEVEKETNHPTISVDVARYGEDETVIGARWGNHFEIVETFRKKPTTHTAGAVVRWVHNLKSRDVRVDDDGIGGGVTDMLREQGIKVTALHGGASPQDPTKFVNARSEWWWHARQWFEAREPDIPDDTKLQIQLTSVHYKLDSRGRIQVESKDDMRKRGVKSPDRADTLVYSIAQARAVVPIVAPAGVPQISRARVG